MFQHGKGFLSILLIRRMLGSKGLLPQLMLTNCSASVGAEHPLDVLHLMFGGFQVQKPYRASTNGFLTYSNSAKYCTRSDSSEREILRQKSLPCVGTPADFILVFRTLPNCLGRIILLNRYKLYHQEIREGK